MQFPHIQSSGASSGLSSGEKSFVFYHILSSALSSGAVWVVELQIQVEATDFGGLWLWCKLCFELWWVVEADLGGSK